VAQAKTRKAVREFGSYPRADAGRSFRRWHPGFNQARIPVALAA
jgi:hypothetical protein